jgi:predicted O-methyltransferase YrrM
MASQKVKLFKQRVNYFTKGNFHGVSANWLGKKCDSLYSSSEQFIRDCTEFHSVDLGLLSVGASHFEDAKKIKSEINYGKNFDCEAGLASFLYAVILTNKPRVVVETGVANGITTNVIMAALEKTGGTLHSFDVDVKTKNVYMGKGNWVFHHLDKDFKNTLLKSVEKIHNIDMWLHDSDHGFMWQSFEYELATKVLTPSGILVSDDIDSSTAWGIASEQTFSKSFGVFDTRKFFGVAKIR